MDKLQPGGQSQEGKCSLLSLCLESVYASSDLGCQAPNDNESDKGLQG